MSGGVQKLEQFLRRENMGERSPASADEPLLRDGFMRRIFGTCMIGETANHPQPAFPL